MGKIMSLFKKIMIAILPLIMLSNLVIASDDSASQISKDSSEPTKKKKSKKVSRSKGSKKSSRSKKAPRPSKAPQAPNKQDIADLELLVNEVLLNKKTPKYLEIADYSAGTENKSTYTSLGQLLGSVAFLNDLEAQENQTKLREIVTQAKKFRGGDGNTDIKTLADMIRNNDGYKREQQLKKACIKEEDLNRVKESFGVTDADVNLETGEVNDADGKKHKLRNLIRSCYPRSE